MRWRDHRDFPGGPMVKTFNAGSVGSIPGQETKISHGTAENKQTNKQTTEDFSSTDITHWNPKPAPEIS